jgi:hypothetical protein
MKNSNDKIGNRARDLTACSAVPQPTAPLRAPIRVSLTAKANIKFPLINENSVSPQRQLKASNCVTQNSAL